jgi:hypothetical protein
MDHFSNSQLEAVEIHADELGELLQRLSATDAMNASGASTIRDVAELTDANPQLIARILTDIRGTDTFENLSKLVNEHELRIRDIEKTASKSEVLIVEEFSVKQFNDEYDEMLELEREDVLTIGFVVLILLALILLLIYLYRMLL